MTDIVERLGRDLMEISYDDIEAMVHEAAAEIARLRRDNEHLTNSMQELALQVRYATEHLDAREAEIERLLAALQSMLTDPPATLDEPDTDAEVIIKMRAIARRALEPKP